MLPKHVRYQAALHPEKPLELRQNLLYSDHDRLSIAKLVVRPTRRDLEETAAHAAYPVENRKQKTARLWPSLPNASRQRLTIKRTAKERQPRQKCDILKESSPGINPE